MPPRSSSRKKSNRQLKKPHNKLSTSQPNRHCSPPLQSQGELDPNILREKNGNCHVKPNSDIQCQFLVVEEKHRKRGVSDTAGHNEMEGSLEETQKVVEESGSEDRHVVGLDEEKVTTIVESHAAEVVAETHQVQEEVDSSTVEQKEEESSPLVELEPEKIRDASDLIVDDIKVLEAELKEKENQGGDSQETKPPSEQTNEPSLALETETSREAEAAIVETTEADADKLDSSEEKKESSSIETNEAVVISESSVPQTDVASMAIEETTPIVKPEETGETNLPAEEQKVEESTVVKEPSKEEGEEEAREPLPPSDVATAETTSTIVQEKTEMPTSTESQKSPEDPAPREHASWSSCCGIFDFLCR